MLLRSLTAWQTAMRISLSAAKSIRTLASTTKSALTVYPVNATSPRESPTPIVFTSGTFTNSDVFHALRSLTAEGYTVGHLDLPGFGKAQSLPKSFTMDNIVDDVQKTLRKLHSPPVVVTSGVPSLLFQKYLESFPLAGAVFLSPLPPNPVHAHQDYVDAAPLVIHLKEKFKLKEGATTASLLRKLVISGSLADDEMAATFVDDSDAAIALESNPEDTGYCGLEASAALLQLVMQEPVKLEANVIPMCVFYADNDPVIATAYQQQFLDFHQPDVVNMLSSTNHELLYSDADAVSNLVSGVSTWIKSRF